MRDGVRPAAKRKNSRVHAASETGHASGRRFQLRREWPLVYGYIADTRAVFRLSKEEQWTLRCGEKHRRVVKARLERAQPSPQRPILTAKRGASAAGRNGAREQTRETGQTAEDEEEDRDIPDGVCHDFD